MDWKTKVLLFVLVLFGSVVPVSARTEAAGGMTTGLFLAALGTVFAILIPLGSLMFMFYRWQNKLNDDAHRKIGENITGVKAEIGENITGVKTDIKADINRVEGNVGRVEGKVDEINIYLRDSATEAVRLGRQSETRKD